MRDAVTENDTWGKRIWGAGHQANAWTLRRWNGSILASTPTPPFESHAGNAAVQPGSSERGSGGSASTPDHRNRHRAVRTHTERCAMRPAVLEAGRSARCPARSLSSVRVSYHHDHLHSDPHTPPRYSKPRARISVSPSLPDHMARTFTRMSPHRNLLDHEAHRTKASREGFIRPRGPDGQRAAPSECAERQ